MNEPLVPPARPLRILRRLRQRKSVARLARGRSGGAHQSSALLVRFDVDGVVQDIEVVGAAPVLGVLELLEGVLDYPSSRAQEAPVRSGCVSARRRGSAAGERRDAQREEALDTHSSVWSSCDGGGPGLYSCFSARKSLKFLRAVSSCSLRWLRWPCGYPCSTPADCTCLAGPAVAVSALSDMAESTRAEQRAPEGEREYFGATSQRPRECR